MTGARPPGASFPRGLDASFSFGPDGRCQGHFGQDVLPGLISGIDGFLAEAEGKPGFRTLGPAMLGAFLWLDDPELIERIAAFPYASIVITKQPRGKRQQDRVDKLKPVLDRCRGFPGDALPELRFLAPREEGGEPPVVGPHTSVRRSWLPPLRTIGYRRAGDRLVPILHTKMALLGELWWHDEDESGIADVTGFRPERLWLASANGTASSRANLEFGVWVTDPALLREATRFLGGLMSHSEDLDPDAPGMEPDLVEPDYDDAAFFEVLPPLDEAGGEGW
jgi:hypothetical protein